MDPGSAPFQIDSALGLKRRDRGPRAEGTGTQLSDQRKHESGTSLSTVELALPLLLFFPRQRVALEIKRDLRQAECGRPEQSIELAASVLLVLHDEGVLLTEIRFAKIRCR